MVKSQELSKDRIRQLINACFWDLAAEADRGFVPATTEPEFELAELQGNWSEVACQVRDQLARHTFTQPVTTMARSHVSDQGIAWEALSPSEQHDILTGVARALLEQQRLVLFRVDDRLLPYDPQDPLFASGNGMPDVHPEPRTAGGHRPVAQPTGPTLGEIVCTFLDRKRKEWRPKTHSSRTTQLGFLMEHIGDAIRIRSVTAQHIREFRDAVTKLRSNHHVGAGKSFASRQTETDEQRIAAKTASLILETAKAFFRWAKRDGYLVVDPSEGIVVDAPKKAKGLKVRRPFTSSELATLFSAPVFLGCKSPRRRFDRGSTVIKDACFWIPLIGFFTGARLGEIVQLHVDDVHLDGPVPYIEITEANGGITGSPDHKHIKSDAGVREIPLHPDLMKLGFASFIADRRKRRVQSPRVFWQVSYGADGQASTTFSKWFARFLDKIGLKDPALVFHSFRHNAEDAYRDALQPQYVIDRIIGHSDGATSAGYGTGVSLETKMSAVQSMSLKADVPSLFALKSL